MSCCFINSHAEPQLKLPVWTRLVKHFQGVHFASCFLKLPPRVRVVLLLIPQGFSGNIHDDKITEQVLNKNRRRPPKKSDSPLPELLRVRTKTPVPVSLNPRSAPHIQNNTENTNQYRWRLKLNNTNAMAFKDLSFDYLPKINRIVLRPPAQSLILLYTRTYIERDLDSCLLFFEHFLETTYILSYFFK